jgi:hypothetical protein
LIVRACQLLLICDVVAVWNVWYAVLTASAKACVGVEASAPGAPTKNPVDHCSAPPKEVPLIVTRCTECANAILLNPSSGAVNLLKDSRLPIPLLEPATKDRHESLRSSDHGRGGGDSDWFLSIT